MLHDEESDVLGHGRMLFCLLRSMRFSLTKIVNIFTNDTKCNVEIVRKIDDNLLISSCDPSFCKIDNKEMFNCLHCFMNGINEMNDIKVHMLLLFRIY